MASLGATAAGSTPDQLAERIKAELAKWAKVVKEAGIVVE
jgi:tripartite-type tricarboxylate transporter receptor subunit TctC